MASHKTNTNTMKAVAGDQSSQAEGALVPAATQRVVRFADKKAVKKAHARAISKFANMFRKLAE